MKFNIDYTVENYLLHTKWSDLPEYVQKRAIVCGIDLLMALIVGSKGSQFRSGLRLAEGYCAPNGEITPLGSRAKLNILGATIAMGHASNSFDIDDGYNMIKGHPGTSFIGGTLAAALEKDVSYLEFLTTLVVTYDVTMRWGLAMQEHYNFLHSTGTYGAYGTAAGIGRLYRLSPKQLNNALSIADFHAPLTPVMRSVEYPSMNKDGVPYGALVGVMAILDTLAGSTGVGNILELPEHAHYTANLGKEYEIMNLYFKPFTCCRWAHQPIQAIIDLKKSYGFTWEEVQKLTVETFDSAAKLSKKIPETTDEAQYNIAWPVASALVYSDVGYNQVCDSALKDEKVLQAMKLLHFEVDPEMEKQFPAKRLAWVKITMKDGKEYTSKVYAAPGEHTDNVDLNWMQKKFYRITRPMLTEAAQEKVLDLLTSNPGRPVRKIIALINELLEV